MGGLTLLRLETFFVIHVIDREFQFSVSRKLVRVHEINAM
jgi:hypothetical protein